MDGRINTLGRWLMSRAYFDEAYDVSMLKLAISLEDAEDLLNNSNRVMKILKGLFWTINLDYSSQELQFISNEYRRSVAEIVPNDLPEKEKAQTIQWLTQLGKHDSDFAYNIVLNALTTLADTTYQDLEERLIQLRPEDHSGGADPVLLASLIEKYFHWKRFMSEQDLMSIKSANEFVSIVRDATEEISKYQQEKAYMDADKGTRLLGETDQYSLYSIHNKGAACEIGKPTDWCTASPGLPYFEKYYHPEDPLFVVKSRGSDLMYQIHFGSNQFMDKNDEYVGKEMQQKLLQVLSIPEVEAYLGTKLFKKFEKIKSKKYTEKDLAELISLTESFASDVIGERSVDDTWVPDIAVREVVRQIDTGHIEDDDMLDHSADFLSKYSPQSFFEVLLAPDYPEIAKRLVEEGLKMKPPAYDGKWKADGISLSSLMEKDLLFQTSEVEDLFEASEEHRKKLSDALIKEQGSSVLFKSRAHSSIYRYIKESVPDFEQKMIASMTLDDKNRLYVKFGLDGRRHVLWRIIEARFHQRFPDALTRIMSELQSSLEKQGLNSSESYEAIDFIKKLDETNLSTTFYPLVATLVESGLRTNYDTFAKYLPKSFNKSINEDLSLIIQDGHDSFVRDWSKPVDAAFPGWRATNYDGLFLSRVFSVAEKLPEAAGSTWMNDYSIKLLIEKKDQFRTKFQEELFKRSQSQGDYNKKVLLPDEMLLFMATFFPNFWEVYNLQYKASVSSEVMNKFSRSLKDLKAHRGNLGADTETYYDHDNDTLRTV